ncbi:MAG: hypothetical protein Q6373_001510 [Candidatus Sigynarchaeota archaeon]
MDLSKYSTFSSLDKSHHAERRLLGKYLPAFDEIRALMESGSVIFVAQRDVTDEWRAILGSAVAAISWDIVQGLDVVMVLLDDPEFGKDIKWFFSPVVVKVVDFKLLLLFVETSMEMMLHVIKDPSIVERIKAALVVDDPIVDRDPAKIRSPSFCLAVETRDIVPRRLAELAGQVNRAAASPALRTALIHGGPFKAPVFSWAILNGLRGCVARDAACMGHTLHVHLDKAILSKDAFSMSLLLMIKIQLEVITEMIAATIDPDRTEPREARQ